MPTKTEAKIKREYGVRMDLLLSTADIHQFVLSTAGPIGKKLLTFGY